MIGAVALPDASPYFLIMMVLGVAGIVIGACGLLYLWWSAPKSKTTQSEPPRQSGSVGIYLGPGVTDSYVEGNEISGMETGIEDHGTSNRHKDNKIG